MCRLVPQGGGEPSVPLPSQQRQQLGQGRGLPLQPACLTEPWMQRHQQSLREPSARPLPKLAATALTLGLLTVFRTQTRKVFVWWRMNRVRWTGAGWASLEENLHYCSFKDWGRSTFSVLSWDHWSQNTWPRISERAAAGEGSCVPFVWLKSLFLFPVPADN